jgi:ATP-dependent helicase HrpB
MDGLTHNLPISDVLVDAVTASRCGAVVVTAPPGSGKTSLVPAAVLDDLPPGQQVVLIQPRRLAARTVARHIAHLRGVPLGGDVGYRVRFDSRVGRDTQLVVVTTGILLRQLLDDISLGNVGAVVIDEFHERTVEMDLVLGLLVRIRDSLKPELRIVVMSATLASEPVAKLLGNCPVIHAEARQYPIQVRYLRRGERKPVRELVAQYLPDAIRATSGHILVFFPGVGEILRCKEAVSHLAERHGCALVPLYGDLPIEEQDRALADLGMRKIILATNVAETSLTIDGVTAVIDTGQARQLRVSEATGLPRLELVAISQASAEQRAGRAGRTGPGICWRLWDEPSHKSRPTSETSEVLRSDLAEPLLMLHALGEQNEFPWLDAPPPDAVANAQRLLFQLGAIDERNEITPIGRELSKLPAHPRLARLLLAGAQRGVLRETSIAAALLSERDPFRSAEHGQRGPRNYRLVRSRSDVADRVAALQEFHAGNAPKDPMLELHPAGARRVLQVAEQLFHLADFPRASRADDPESALMQALLEAFPDRLAKLRPGTQDRALLVGGRGVRLESSSRVHGQPLFLAIELNDVGGEARVRIASAVERSWLPADRLATREELFFNPTRRQVEARSRVYWDDLLLEETPVAIQDMAAAAQILAHHAKQSLERVLPAADSGAGKFLARVQWLAAAMPELGIPSFNRDDLEQLLSEMCVGLRSLNQLAEVDWVPWVKGRVGYDRVPTIDRLAPRELELPSGKHRELVYEPGKLPILAVRIQEIFGWRETPRIADGRVPVLLHLLGPNGRTQQVTSDLASFWQNGYPELRKELRRRYSKHAWPEDPLSATAMQQGKGKT